jgi:hypothetical protein
LDSARTVISQPVSLVMAIIAMPIAPGQHVRWDSRCSTLKNVGRIVKLIKLGIVLITVAGVIVGYFGCRQNKDVLGVMRIVGSALDHQTKCA